MPEVSVKDKNNKVVEKMTIPERLFAVEMRADLLHEAVRNYLANQRQGTHAAKSRGMVRGGGKKPWRQKNTGRARHGSIRSPLWKGGGVVFGARPRDYSYKMPKKQRRRALATALSAKLRNGDMTLIDSLAFESPRTRDMMSLLSGLGLEGKSVLVVMPDKDENVYLSARNIPGVTVVRVLDLNTYALLAHNQILMTRDAFKKLQEVWG